MDLTEKWEALTKGSQDHEFVAHVLEAEVRYMTETPALSPAQRRYHLVILRRGLGKASRNENERDLRSRIKHAWFEIMDAEVSKAVDENRRSDLPEIDTDSLSARAYAAAKLLS